MLPSPAALRDDQIAIWCVSADLAETIEPASSLTPAEQSTAARLQNLNQRRTWIAVRAALRQLLAQALHQSDPRALVFYQNRYGKPYLPDNPALRFNVSHSGTLGLIAIIPAAPSSEIEIEIGIDIEYQRPDLAIDALFPQTFSPAETAYLQRLDTARQRDAFYRLWVRKEAAIKAIGKGLSCPLDTFSALAPAIPELDAVVVDLPVPAGYQAACALSPASAQPLLAALSIQPYRP